MARLYSFRSVGYLVGMVVGPLIGGHLSRPSKTWPDLFSSSSSSSSSSSFLSVFDEYPFLLPCLVVSCLNGFTFLFCLVFMKESMADTPPFLVGLRRFFVVMGLQKEVLNQNEEERGENEEEKTKNILLEKEQKENKNKTTLTTTTSSSSPTTTTTSSSSSTPTQTSIPKLLKEPFIGITIGLYMMFSFVHLNFQEVFSLWVVLSKEDGGLGFVESDIGNCLAMAALFCALFTLFLFPFLVRKLGSLLFWEILVVFGVPLYLFLPLLNWLARVGVLEIVVWGLLYFVLASQKIHSSSSFSTINVCFSSSF